MPSTAYRNYLTEALPRYRVPGAAVLLEREGEVLLHEGFGFADVADERRVTPDTVFGIASITKSFTTMSVLQLAEAGRLREDQRAAEFFPAFARPGLDRIELRHLMSNSSGLPPMGFRRNALSRSIEADPSRELLGLDMKDHLPPIDTAEELAAAIAELNPALLGEPGTIYSYSNEAFGLLTRVIELASGRDYVDYVTDNILRPLDMTRSVFRLDDLAALDDVSNLYSYIGGFERVEATPGYYWAPSLIGTGYLRSTVADLARYAAVHNGRSPVEVLSPAGVKRMSEPVVQVSPGVHYGYGLMIRGEQHGVRTIHHGGSTKGVGAHLAMVPSAGVTCVVLTNITNCPVSDFAFTGVNAALGLPLDTPQQRFEAVDVDPETLETYVGTFSSLEFEKVRIELDRGELIAHSGTTSAPATPVAGNALTFEQNGSTLLVQLLEPSAAGGYETIRFGSRVLHRDHGE